MVLNNFCRLEEVGPQGDLYVFHVSRARASAFCLAGGLVVGGACLAVALLMHPAFLVLLGPIAAGFILLSLVLVWSQCTLEIHAASRRLRLRERFFFRERLREWTFQEIEGLIIFGDDPGVGVLQLKFPYGVRVSLGRGTRDRLNSLSARLVELTGIRVVR
ncbi:MAG TPA: hypothetical protein VKW04_19960 [Planctomycetota bacterium]|nr:hypothetical protein [Planctomycetota bacterium]